MNLEVRVAGLELQHPVLNASGIMGESLDGLLAIGRSGVSALVTKSYTPSPRQPYPMPRVIHLDMGSLNAVGLANPGIEGLRDHMRALAGLGIPIIVSVAGSLPEDFAKVAAVAEEAGAAAVELNLSCPHVEKMGLDIGMDPVMSRKVVSAVASTVKIPVIAKLGISDKMVETAEASLEAGAKGLTLINTVRAMRIDVYSLRPALGHGIGGLSGPAIHPIAVRAVYEVYRELRPDIFGAGGVERWEDAVELILAGAKAVQVGSGLVRRGLQVIGEIKRGIADYMNYMGFKSLTDMVGAAARQ
ncbi:Dihydroorotate dehydrogenase [Acidilobus saccharovorans 345-15]|uniref:Dihydroorotate dehydrogenase n=1 Tax=Acidilobus saccharovorans (strain DSM 16705 / JCM 18335 / VKM B-2471 / 345-15) TaxID=666510 RepID=D9Q234_ACIS3|nr:dihydroorotate dehydrogenase PyrD [Acidilobus saccharovorans]ADL19372.1 Dihydroorotate dehydrogenase [Acidilobus saccharovorans 345-15]